MLIEFLKKLRDIRTVYVIKRNEIRKIKKNKPLYKDIKLTQEQIDKIDKLWLENYGKTISKDWHRFYMSYSGKFNENYFPELYFCSDLLLKLNDNKRRFYLDDKILTLRIFSGIKEPNVRTIENYVYNCNGYFYNQTGIINYEKALKTLYNIGEVVIKPTVESGHGNNVRLINIKNGIDILSNTKLEKILKQYDRDYAIQEKIIQHPVLEKLNATSVNTFRIWTYICEDEVYAASPVLRIGRKNGKLTDNFSGGGVAVGINKDGTLMKYAYSQNGKKFTKHPDSHVLFEGYQIPNLNDMIEFVIHNHYRIPHIGFIGWDLTLDKDGKFVLIETNLDWPGIRLTQEIAGEGIFGENTAKMIRQLKK